MKYLFVGGPWDGRREEASGMPYMQVVVARPFKIPMASEATIPDISDIAADVHLYRLDRFASGEKRYEVYMHSKTIPEGGGMNALIEGYPVRFASVSV